MSAKAITEDEAALYDRQIRLWGLDAQKRMRASDVLVVGVNGLTGEVIKNTVLAGINSLTILDDKEVTEEHLSAMFFVNSDHLGQNVAEASVEAIRKLNPLVKVTADSSDIKEKESDYFTLFHVVCMSVPDTNQLIRVNQICHDKSIKFFCGCVFGFYGFMFSDLGDHEYAEETKVAKKEEETDEGPSAAKQPKLSADAPTESAPPTRSAPSGDKKPEMETVTVKKQCQFERLKSTLNVDWTSLTPKRLKKISTVYFIIRCLLDYCTEAGGGKPRLSDTEAFTTQCGITMKSLQLDYSLIEDKFMASMACVPEMSPVCAVVGGVLGQEILKAVSQKDAPHNNYFLYDPETNAGIVESVHSKSFLPPTQKKREDVEELIL